MHNSEYGTFAKDKPLVHSELSDDQQAPDELRSAERSKTRKNFELDKSDIATTHVPRPRRLKSLGKPKPVK